MTNTSRMYSWYFTQYEDLEDQIWTMIHQIASLMLYQMCYQYWQIFILILIDFDMLDGYYIYIYISIGKCSFKTPMKKCIMLVILLHSHALARARACIHITFDMLSARAPLSSHHHWTNAPCSLYFKWNQVLLYCYDDWVVYSEWGSNMTNKSK